MKRVRPKPEAIAERVLAGRLAAPPPAGEPPDEDGWIVESRRLTSSVLTKRVGCVVAHANLTIVDEVWTITFGTGNRTWLTAPFQGSEQAVRKRASYLARILDAGIAAVGAP